MGKSKILLTAIFVLVAIASLFIYINICGQKNNSSKPHVLMSRPLKPSNASKTEIEFRSYKHDFGTLQSGDTAMHTYVFTNTGSNPLIVHDVTVSCGCTIADYTKKPILPKTSGEIKVLYKTAGKSGKQHVNILVYSNATEQITPITLTGFVE